MSDLELRSLFEFDEHRHMFMMEDGTPVARIRFAKVADGREGAVNCSATVWYDFGAKEDAPPIMEYQRTNLTNKTSAIGWGKVSGVIQGIDPREWEPLIQQAISASMKAWHEASVSSRVLVRANPDEVEVPFVLAPLVSSTGLTLLYSAPGVGKSMMALAAAISVATGANVLGSAPTTVGPVVYVDFEDDASTHDIRFNAILNGIDWDGEDPAVTHFTVYGKFSEAIGPIRSLIRETGAVMVVLDSMGQARGTDPSDGDSTIKLTKGIRSFGVPCLAIDHVTKADNKDMKNSNTTNPDAVMAIGSQFSTAGARLGWFVQEMSTSTQMARRFNMHNPKHNHVAKQQAYSMAMNLENNKRGLLTSITFENYDSVVFEELKLEDTAVTMLKIHVRHAKPVGGSELARMTSISRSTVVSNFNRRPEWWQKVEGTTQYELTEAAIAAATLLTGGQQS